MEGENAKRREELRTRIENALYRDISCVKCGRSWKALKDPPPAKTVRIFAMPPDDLPAGACPECGNTYCIGCAKENLDDSGRFLCPICGKNLKLSSEGLKKIVFDWAAEKNH
jgi:transcription elongation factor Elf1